MEKRHQNGKAPRGQRDVAGRFVNVAGPGRPRLPEAIRELRETVALGVTPDDLRAIVAVLVDAAKQGDIQACREVLNRVCGRPGLADDLAAEKPDPAAARPGLPAVVCAPANPELDEFIASAVARAARRQPDALRVVAEE